MLPAFHLLVRYVRRALILVGLLVVLVTFTPLDSWWATWLARPWNDPSGDTLIVLAGSCLSDGTIGENTYWRSIYAVRIWKEGGFKEILLSGGPPKAPCSAAMRDFIVAEGVPASSVLIETQSQSTRENALDSAPLLQTMPGSKVLLTSDYHIFRASRAFDRIGVPVLPRPIPDALKRAESYRGRWGAFLDLAQETIKIAYYKARGWI